MVFQTHFPEDFCRQKLAKLAIVISSIGETVATSKVGVGHFGL